MTNQYGSFVWYELMTDDIDAAQAFYGELLGWQVVPSGQPALDYRIAQVRDPDNGDYHDVAGLLQLSPDMKAGGAEPAWLGYIAAEDIDACVAQIETGGGKVHMPVSHVPGVGRLAMVSDPQGAPFYVISPEGEGESLAFAFDKPRSGHCAWNELATRDPEAAKRFYGTQFGWIKEGEMDMPGLGPYEFLQHRELFGAVMPLPKTSSDSMWNFYFRVSDIDQAVAFVTSAGGTLLAGPDEIPGGDFALTGIDPQGAKFALVGQKQR